MAVVDVQQPLAAPPNPKACLTTFVKGELTADDGLTVLVQAAFLPVTIPRGLFIKTECHVATTGARFEATAERATVENLSDADAVHASYTIANTAERFTQNEPKVETKSGPTEFKVTLGSNGTKSSSSKTTVFDGQECRLAVVESTESFIRWHLRPDRGTKAVADYLEGTLWLKARAKWSGSAQPVVTVTAQPTDIRVFGSRGEELRRRSSIALLLKLRLTGHSVPSMKRTEHVVRVLNEPAGETWAQTPLS